MATAIAGLSFPLGNKLAVRFLSCSLFFRRFETARTALRGVMKCDLLRIQIACTLLPDVAFATLAFATAATSTIVFSHAAFSRAKERPA
ncbi:hypothetical protein TMES_03900 [Thalassospira mesophila]|uniref:Uncharacterized protein n=1 Tax=Thalassospira mesophila TaxID=1293891 RepID=A0A1Y2L4T5_9PROT|nr:hypothetical protein TMES_03900 [Thalassospira mesophila]